MDYFEWLENFEKKLTPRLKRTYTVISGGQNVSTEKVCCHLTSDFQCRRSLKNYGDMAIPHSDLD